MKGLLLIASSVMLLLPDLSLAQPPGPPPGGGGNPGQNRPNRPGGPGPGQPNRPGGAVTLPGTVNTTRPPSRPPGNNMRPPSRPPGPSMRPPPRPGGPQFTWRGRNFNRFRAPAFFWPRGFGYRRWTTGAFLPSIFWSSQYWFDDWRFLGIGAPPPGRRWVRYGPDLLLVNMRTRRIEDVIYDVFF